MDGGAAAGRGSRSHARRHRQWQGVGRMLRPTESNTGMLRYRLILKGPSRSARNAHPAQPFPDPSGPRGDGRGGDTLFTYPPPVLGRMREWRVFSTLRTPSSTTLRLPEVLAPRADGCQATTVTSMDIAGGAQPHTLRDPLAQVHPPPVPLPIQDVAGATRVRDL